MIVLADIPSDLFRMPQIIFTVGGVIAVIAIIFHSIFTAVTKVSVARERERSRREIAAYVAEGTIEADKAIAMLQAGPSSQEA